MTPYQTFDDCLAIVLKEEGGLSNVTGDFGKKTKYGITQVTYDTYRTRISSPIQDVAEITQDEARTIYFEDFWKASSSDVICENAKPKLALLQFNVSVERNPVRAVCMLQKIFSIAPQTGFFGPRTLACVQLCDENSTVYTYLDDMKAHFEEEAKIPNQQKFLKGWLNRLNYLSAVVGSNWNVQTE